MARAVAHAARSHVRDHAVLALHAWVELIRSSTEGSGHGA